MARFAETSFLFACFVDQVRSRLTEPWLESVTEPTLVSRFVRYEFEQGVRFEAFLRRTKGHRGIPIERVPQILAAWEVELDRGTFQEVPCDWLQVANLASDISDRHTIARGCRAFDLLHIATALHLGAREFLSFDALQREVAEAEGLRVPL